jgi:tRNA G10  N-methylase Trm11
MQAQKLNIGMNDNKISNSPSMKPSTAYTLLSLACPRLGEVVIDLSCSSGSLIVEAAFAHNCVAIGGDNDLSLIPVYYLEYICLFIHSLFNYFDFSL